MTFLLIVFGILAGVAWLFWRNDQLNAAEAYQTSGDGKNDSRRPATDTVFDPYAEPVELEHDFHITKQAPDAEPVRDHSTRSSVDKVRFVETKTKQPIVVRIENSIQRLKSMDASGPFELVVFITIYAVIAVIIVLSTMAWPAFRGSWLHSAALFLSHMFIFAVALSGYRLSITTFFRQPYQAPLPDGAIPGEVMGLPRGVWLQGCFFLKPTPPFRVHRGNIYQEYYTPEAPPYWRILSKQRAYRILFIVAFLIAADFWILFLNGGIYLR